jgi:WD40-like Beta Propeller Repeat
MASPMRKTLTVVAAASAIAAVGAQLRPDAALPKTALLAQRSIDPRTSPKASVESAPTGAILYSIGVSTDPYGGSSPRGFGVVTSFGTARQRNHEVRNRGLGSFGGTDWIDQERILVPRKAPPFRRPLVYRFSGGQLQRVGPSPLPLLEAGQAWSPDGRWIASEPIERCKKDQRTIWECYRNSGRIYLYHADGSHRRALGPGHFDHWTPDGRLLVTDTVRGDLYASLDVRTGKRTLPIAPRRVADLARRDKVGVGPPRWSADRRYLAARIGASWPKKAKIMGALVVAHADGRPIRIITSPYIISMFAWSPVGHRLAYTTSGFPDPHELFVVASPEAKPVRLFSTGARHFDWITWSPDGRLLLVDDEHANVWRLMPSAGPRRIRALPRLGGRPLWCCPVNAYGT